ncbi:DUF5710 domain-containing protein [Comamonas thiooxydans]|uniref:DUF5710 domain-containing protein n=1 Tax=Comamonas thiooxydans TaxID=363952 RepID=UPI003519FDB1
MRVNLVAPYSEKEEVKALGARWDPTLKTWYVENVENLELFQRWLPGGGAPSSAGGSPSNKSHSRPRKASIPTDAALDVQLDPSPRPALPDCGCDALPWEDCVHTK